MAELTTDYDYSMIGSFGSEATQSLSGDTINKLRAAEEKARLLPIEQDLESWELESEKITGLQAKVDDFLAQVKQFDLFSSTNNVFDQISASSTGTSAIFDATDVGSLQEGTYHIDVTQLAQKDVWQSNGYTLAGAETALGVGTLTINGTDFTTDGLTLQELADSINLNGAATASVEQTGVDEYKLVLKSSDPGTANALTIVESGVTFGFNDAGNHTLTAQNLQATIDGVAYDVSSNSITVEGNLKVTATEIGGSTLSIQKDDSAIMPAVQDLADAYNEIAAFITAEIYDTESPIEDKSTLRNMLSNIKNMFFQEYGPDNTNAVNFGFEFDKDGLLIIDTTALGEALTTDYDSVKNFFLGTAEDKGFGTLMKEYMDDINSYDGVLTKYAENMLDRKTDLEDEKEQTIEDMETKYGTMASQFVEYASIIAQMEASFSGLQLMIQQSTAK